MATHQSRHHHGLGFDDAIEQAPPAPPAPSSAATAAAAAAAALVAARLSAQMAARAAEAGPSHLPAGFSALAPPLPVPEVDISSITDPVERARAIAAKISGNLAPSVLGKRKLDGVSGGAEYAWGTGGDTRRRKKLYVPKDSPDINWKGLILGPRVRDVTARPMMGRRRLLCYGTAGRNAQTN
jgi:hypothetical protein